jgi:glycosyltransferase involved in cell wall biosynthesis
MSLKLSIILPTFNEVKSNLLYEILNSFQNLKYFELIVVDSNSEDETLSIIQNFPLFKENPQYLKIISTSSTKRGEKLNLGLSESRGELILLHHPRSFIPEEGISVLFRLKEDIKWGAFRHNFNKSHFLLKFTSWYSNYIRGKIRSIYYLDHCIFANRELLLLIGIPKVEIFEDTILCLNLKKKYKPILLKEYSITSSVRFDKNGYYFQSILNQFMKIGFYLRIPYSKLNYFYEKSLELNAKITKK